MILKKFSFSALLLSFICLSTFAQDTTQVVTANKFNSAEQEQKPYVVLISIDAFRWDFADKYQAKNLIKLRDSGVQADYLKPSYPSLTFPNHYTIATGLYPSHHGLVDNIFYDKNKAVVYRKSDKKIALDSSWYGGKPLWILAEEQKMLSAVFYWPGSEVSMNNIRPTYYFNYNEVIPMERRLNIVKDWLYLPTNKRPHFIALYFPQVDKAAHIYAAESEQTRLAVQEVDEAIGRLVSIAKETGLPVNFIIVSDHGMTTVDNVNTIKLPNAINKENFVIPPGTGLLQLYAKDIKYIQSTYKALKKEAKNYEVYLPKYTPKYWHYRPKDDVYNRIGDILLVPKLPNVFSINGAKPELGQHGFDPKLIEMYATFYAAGPQLKSGIKIPAFENVNIYPLIAKILGLDISHPIDGRLKVLSPILK